MSVESHFVICVSQHTNARCKWNLVQCILLILYRLTSSSIDQLKKLKPFKHLNEESSCTKDREKAQISSFDLKTYNNINYIHIFLVNGLSLVLFPKDKILLFGKRQERCMVQHP
jgi:hypothetical protein